MTLGELMAIERLTPQQLQNDLSEILASFGEPPMYAERLKKLRSGKPAKSSEIRALLQYTSNLIDSYKEPD